MWRVVPIVLAALPFWWLLPLTGLARAGAALACGAATYLVLAWSLKRLFFTALTTPFKLKGAVLRGAQVDVHRVERIELASLPEGRDDDDAAPVEAWQVEATVTPTAPPSGNFNHWEPGELELVPTAADVGPDARASSEVTVRLLEVEDERRWVADPGMKYAGPQRLRLTLACAKPQRGALKFRYYFEAFGEVRLDRPPLASRS